MDYNIAHGQTKNTTLHNQDKRRKCVRLTLSEDLESGIERAYGNFALARSPIADGTISLDAKSCHIKTQW